MESRTPVFVFARDAVTQAGLEYLLRLKSELYVVPSKDIDSAQVAVIGTDLLDDDAVRIVCGVQRDGCPRVAVVAANFDEEAITAAGRAGVLGLLRRSEASPDHLVTVVRRVASGGAVVPEDMVASLLSLAARPAGSDTDSSNPDPMKCLSDREQEVIRLLADGCDTSEIASNLCYSERTVKGVIHGMTNRLQLKNRSHAVAYALRQGMI